MHGTPLAIEKVDRTIAEHPIPLSLDSMQPVAQGRNGPDTATPQLTDNHPQVPTAMKLVYFSSRHNGSCKQQLVRSISRALPDLEVEAFVNVDALHNRLQVHPHTFFAAILEPHDRTTLMELVQLKAYLGDSRVILHLPDDSRQCFTYSSKLTPRCLLSSGDSKEAIISVLSKWKRAEDRKAESHHA